MSRRDTILLAVVGVVATFAAAWFLAFAPKQREASALDQQLTTAKAEVAASAGTLAQLRATQEQLLGDPASLSGLRKALPRGVAMPRLLRELERTADRSRVDMTALTTGAGTTGAAAATPTAGITSIGLSLTFEGRFADLQRFIARLQRLVELSKTEVMADGRLITLKSIRLAPEAEQKTLTAAVEATVHLLDPASLAAPATADPTTTVPTAQVTR